MEVQSISGGDAIPASMSTKSEVRREEPKTEEPLNNRTQSADSEGKGHVVDSYA
jgi:hypothetical protein